MAAAMGGCLQDLGQWASLHLPRALLAVQDEAAHLSPNAAAASPPLPPPQPLPGPSPSSGSFRPSVAVVVGVLTTMFSITFLLLLYAKHCRRTVGAGRPYGGASGFFGMGAASLGRRNSGVDRAVVESLPVFRFGSLRGGRKEGVECAVCLGRFRAEELLRLLPKCRHAFHVECVDTWLDAHSTCPICRHRVDPEDVLLAFHDLEPPAGPKPHPAAAPADPEEVLLGSAAGAPSPAGGLVGFLWGGRRLSGRHSSAGEKHSDSALQVVVHWAGPDGRAQRSSVDNAVMLRGAAAMAATKASAGRFDGPGGVRKDVLLLAESAEDTQRRSVNRLVVSGDGDTEGSGAAMPRRWSDMRPQDLQHLRRDMVLSDGGRASSCSSSGGEAGVTGARSVSEITGLSRFAARRAGGAGAGGRAEEERVLRRWLSLASRRAGRWLGLREEPGGSGR